MDATSAGGDKPARLSRLDSVVLVPRLDPNAKSASWPVLRQDTTLSSVFENAREKVDVLEHGPVAGTPIGLDVSIRFDRLGVFMVLSLSILATLIVRFNRGVEIGHFNPLYKNDTETKRLLDDYNSYTGNVASIFSRPIEILVTLAVQVLFLRVLASSLLRAEISWKMDALTLVVSAGIGYMISNGLNALNVQLQPPTIKPVISASDLMYVPEASVSDAAKRSTNLSQSYPEQSDGNPITNTILRNLVLPRVPVKKPYCNWTNATETMGPWSYPDLVLEYGFSQRDWQSRVLQEAPKPKQLRINVTRTQQGTNQHLVPQDLPMTASLAADLLMYGVGAAMKAFPWYPDEEYMSFVVAETRYTNRRVYDSAARVHGLLPPSVPVQDEMAQRAFFLRQAPGYASRAFNGSDNNTPTPSNVELNFSHVDISSSVWFDAITIEFEIDPASVNTIVDKKRDAPSHTTVKPEFQCGPWEGKCMIPKPLYSGEPGGVYDPPAQVRVFGSCVNSRGTEELAYVGDDMDNDCFRMSNTSMMVLSIGKRFLADSIATQRNQSSDKADRVVVTNMRRIYTLTMGKLSWKPSDLASEFNANCGTDEDSCHGLRLPLLPATTNSSQLQELIVGVDGLPLDVLELPVSDRPEYVPLVLLHEPKPLPQPDDEQDEQEPLTEDELDELDPPIEDEQDGLEPLIEDEQDELDPLIEDEHDESQTEDEQNENDDFVRAYDSLAGDPLLRHNIHGNFEWHIEKPKPNDKACNTFFEERLQLILNNHMYIEHGLQTAYTAATFFLFQNAVIRDVVQMNATATTLGFRHNTQRIALLASIPNQNAWLTLGGCALLLLSLCAAMAWSWYTSTTITGDRICGLGHVQNPHVVARVMLDSVHFPPLFLERRVIGVIVATDDATSIAPAVEGFLIDGLTLQPPTDVNRVQDTDGTTTTAPAVGA